MFFLGCRVGGAVGWLVGAVSLWLGGWLVGAVSWLRLVGWLVGCRAAVDRLVGWLVGVASLWLVGWCGVSVAVGWLVAARRMVG